MQEEEEDHRDPEEEDPQAADLQPEVQEKRNHSKPTKGRASHLEPSPPSLKETAPKLRAFCAK